MKIHEFLQAASSAHAAELLTSSGHPLQIVTFGDCEPFTTTSLENRDADENFFDAEIQIALRKTTKRDLHTREKVHTIFRLKYVLLTVQFFSKHCKFEIFITIFNSD